MKEVRSFLGLAGYYHRSFIIMHPVALLTNLLRKEAFVWGVAQQDASYALRYYLSSTSVLMLSNFTKAFQLETDASGVGIGATLS